MRELYLAAVARRIGSRDRRRMATPEAGDEVDLLLGYLPVADGVDAEVAAVLGMFFMVCGIGPGGDQQDLMRATVLLTPTYLTEPDALPDEIRSWIEQVDPVARLRAGSAAEAVALTSSAMATMLADRFLRRPVPGNRAELLGLVLRTVADVPAGHPLRDPVLCQLGDAVLIAGPDATATATSADPALLAETIEALRAGLDRLPADDASRARGAAALAATIRVAAEVSGDHRMLAEAMDLMRTAAEADVDDDRPVMRLALEHVVAVRALPLPGRVAADVYLSEAAILLADPHLGAEQRAAIEEAHSDLVDALARRQRALDRTPADFFDEAMARWGYSADDGDPTVREIRALVARVLGADPGGELGDSRVADLLAAGGGEQADELAYLADFGNRMIGELYGGDELLPATAPGRSDHSDHSDLDEVLGVVERTLAESPPGTDDAVAVELVHILLLLRRMPSTADAESVAALEDLGRRLGPMMHTVMTGFSERFSTREQVQTRAALEIGRLSPFGTLGAVDDAVARYRAELAAAPERPDTLTYLAHALFGRYLFTSERAVFDEAVGLARRTLTAAIPPDPALVFMWGLAACARSMGATPGESSASGLPGSVMRILDGDASAALVALEREKAHMLSAAVTAGAEIDSLRAARPDLAARVRDLRARSYEAGDLVSGPGARDREQALTDAWDTVLAEIRVLPGFDRFLLPASLEFADLAAAADDGPVIAISVSELRCDALVLRDGAVRVVPLPDLLAPDLVARAEEFRAALRSLQSLMTAPATEAEARRGVTDTLAWLWDVVAEPVLEGLGFGPRRVPPWPRVWWVPTGALTALPLHAAGRHDTPGASVLDRAVSSYTPTVRALQQSRARRPPERVSALAVAMPHTPGHPALPATVEEAAAFADRFGGPPPLVGPEATRATVSAALPTATLVHFACHASSDPLAPWASHLVLHDGPLSAAEISDLRLDGAELAYLSACSTAGGSAVLADEAIHISSAFQLAGYAQAVGTLWPIADAIAARAATEFHHELSTGATRLPGAVALHEVVRRMRAEGVDPWHWAAYVHSGA